MEEVKALKRKRRVHYAQMLISFALIVAARGGLAALESFGVIPQGSIAARVGFIAITIVLCFLIVMAGSKAATCSGEIETRLGAEPE